MTKILVVVESPGKIHKIQSILGSDYLVAASVGHIIDLSPKSMSIDIANSFTPKYSPMDGKSNVIANLKKLSAKCSDVLIATDEDREGEMIAWSIAHVLNIKNAKRIVFNSITKQELLNAVKNPKTIDFNMVNAQKARRILDRIVGYEVSPLLGSSDNKSNLSAGRVQSVVVRLIIDKETSITEFIKEGYESFFKFKGIFKKDSTDTTLTATLHDITKKDKTGVYKGDITKMESKSKAKKLVELYTKAEFTVANIFNKESVRNPSPPFTTSTLQQESSKKFNMTVKRTMDAAQRLYEAGFITYMRTDSVNLSDEALTSIKKCVLEKFGSKFYKLTKYKSKGANTQEAHEAIRPTDFTITNVVANPAAKISQDEIKLYSLIWKRAVASQMAPAIFDIQTVQIDISNDKKRFFTSCVEVLKFAGFLKVYNLKDVDEKDDADKKSKQTALKPNDPLTCTSLTATLEYTKPPTRYNEASLIEKLDPKNLNIGRPSTYASIISKILDRGYVVKKDIEGDKLDAVTLSWSGKLPIKETKSVVLIGAEKSRFVPTDLGVSINKMLVDGLPPIMDYNFTADMEKKLDKVAVAKTNWVTVLTEFYNKFHPLVVEMAKNRILVNDNVLSRTLGQDESGIEIIATIKRYGPVVMKMQTVGKPICAPIKDPLKVETVTLAQALELLEYPKVLGQYKNKDIMLKKGLYGLYIEYCKHRVSVVETDITLESAIKKLKAHMETKKAGKGMQFKSKTKCYNICEGPYGKYIRVAPIKTTKDTKTFNVKLPTCDISKLDITQIEKIVEKHLSEKQKKS
jgi:DNA topoisomerase-1